MQLDHQNPRVGHRGSMGSRAKDLMLKAVAITVGAAFVVGAFVVSIVFLAVALAVALVVVGYLWWRTRHVRRQMREGKRPGGGDVIEGTVLKSE